MTSDRQEVPGLGGGLWGRRVGIGGLDEVEVQSAHWPGGLTNLELIAVLQHEIHGSIIRQL